MSKKLESSLLPSAKVKTTSPNKRKAFFIYVHSRPKLSLENKLRNSQLEINKEVTGNN